MLATRIQQAYHVPFQWGEHDCALWCADWVFEATGADLLSDWRGKYKTAAGAARLMKRRKFSGVAAIAAKHLPEINPAMAKRGDILLHPDGSLGVCYGRHGFFLTPDSVTTIPVGACPRAWAVE